MLKCNRLLPWATCLVAALVVSCSSDKVLPQGKRVSVLEQATALKPEVSAPAKMIKIRQAKVNNEWLQNDDNAQHLTSNIKAGTGFVRQWKADFGAGRSKRNSLLAKPLAFNGKVYTLDVEGLLTAFDLDSGERVWRYRLEAENKYADASAMRGVGMAAQDNVIYAVAGFGTVFALNAENGEEVWKKDLKVPLRIAPSVAAGKVFVQSVDNQFFALDKNSGEILWNYDIAMENTTVLGGASASYCPDLDMVLIGFSNGEIQSFNASLGTPLWSDILVANRQAYSSTFLHTIKASPVIDGETAFVAGSSDVLASIDIRSGTRNWDKSIGSSNALLLSGNTLFVVTTDNELTAIDKASGKVLWVTAVEMPRKKKDVKVYAPILLDGKLAVALSNGEVLLYEAASGKKISKIDLDEKLNGAPIVVGDYVIFTTDNAKVIAYK